MRASLDDVCGCFPTGRHYPGIADRLALQITAVAGLCKHLPADAAWIDQKLAVIDFETTGLTPEQDRVIEIGIVCFERGELSLVKNWLVNPEMPVPEQARAVHNITDEDLAHAEPFASLIAEVQAALEGHLPVAYNADFDRAFLGSELDRAGITRTGKQARSALPPAFDPEVTWVDPLVWVRELYKDERGHKLTDMCGRLGIALSDAHRAAADAEATGRVLLALAPRMPASYGELIRLQGQYAARQDVDMAMTFRRRG